MPPLLIAVFRALVYAIFAGALWRVYRSAYRASPQLAFIFGLGVAARVILGALLFVISYFHLPFFQSAQMGEGFWTLALDGRWYFDVASEAVRSGLDTISDGSASPFYVRVLAIWMWLFGVNPLSAAALNLACYAASTALVVAAAPNLTAARLAVGVLTLSPAMLIFGTQALKDTLCALLLTMAIAGMRLWLVALEPGGYRLSRVIGAAALLAGALYGIGGIRAYLGMFLLLGYVAVALWSIYKVLSRADSWAFFGAQLTLGLILWMAFAAGAGAYYLSYRALILRTVLSPVQPFIELRVRREGFARAGGATSTIASESQGERSLTAGSEAFGPGDRVQRRRNGGPIAEVENLALGWALLFVPVTLLKGLTLVNFPGGRGLLFITDIDTIVMDAAIAGSIFLLVSSHRGPRSVPVLLFSLVLALTTAVAISYVVTNFGTLFRLRLTAAVPLWLLPAFSTLTTSRDQRFHSS